MTGSIELYIHVHPGIPGLLPVRVPG